MAKDIYKTLGGRNNNPGCIRKGKGYKKYASLEEGYSDLARLLINSYNNKTAYQIFRKYAPSSDGNNPLLYAKTVIKNLNKRGIKVGTNTVLDLKNPEILAAVMVEISKIECGGVLGSVDLVRQCAYNQLGKNESYQEQHSSQTNTNASRMVQLYYDEVEQLGYLSEKAPKRRKEASQGVIVENNIPKIEDKNPFAYQKLKAIANVNKILQDAPDLKNPTQNEITSYIKQQTDNALKACVEQLRESIEKKDFRCTQALNNIVCTAAIQSAEKAYARDLNQEEKKEIISEIQNKINGFNIKENPQQIYAYCEKISTQTKKELNMTKFLAENQNPNYENSYTLGFLSNQNSSSILKQHSQSFKEKEQINQQNQSKEYIS